MAYRRCITARAKQLYEQQRVAPSLSYTNHRDDDTNNKTPPSSNYSFPCRAFGALNGSNIRFQQQRFAPPLNYAAYASVLGRNMSSSAGNDAAGKAELMSDMDVFVDGTLEAVTQVAPALSEVAVAAADSFLPVAALQYAIHYVHVATGFNWWSSIALTTIGIRCLMIPFTVHQLKAASRFSLLKPHLEEIQQEMQAKGMTQEAASEGQAKMHALYKEYKVTPFTPMKGILITGPLLICFFLAIRNMAEKVPSFQQGGAYWFLDLTTPDPMYILPAIAALTFWITVELNAQEGMEGNPTAKTMKNVSRGLAALTIPLTASFVKAVFCYWITANVFSLVYGLVIKKPEVKKFLGIPIIPDTPPSPASQHNPNFSFFDAIKKFQVAAKQNAEKQAEQRQSLAASSPTEASKGVNQQIPSSAILRQRIKSLGKEVKGRKKRGKKRC